jgi:hypothetical protein
MLVLINKLIDKYKEDGLSEDEKKMIVEDFIKDYFKTATKHSFTSRHISNSSALIASDIDDTIEEISLDIETLYNQISKIIDGIISNFNYITSEKQMLSNKIKQVSSTINEYNLITKSNNNMMITINDDFNTEGNIDKGFGSGSAAHVDTSTGIVTLEHAGSVNISEQCEVDKIVGNGTAGNYHLIISEEVTDYSTIISSNNTFLSEKDPHDDESVILDKLPTTWFEYQMLNIPNDVKLKHQQYTDLSWATGSQVGDKLRAKITVVLDNATDINWININPYLPGNGTNKLTVYSISTSEDGLLYAPIYGDEIILNSDLNVFSNTYDYTEIADDSIAKSNFASQGVWNFPTRKVKYIEIVLDQNESYPVKIGIPIYNKIIQKIGGNGAVTETSVRVAENEVSKEIREAIPGKYQITPDTYIEKRIEEVSGWRYCIGLKDVNVFKYTFVKQSEIVSVEHEFEKNISSVSLSVKETIPENMLINLSQRNDWIKYYISFNNVEWYQISASSHYKIGNSTIPPKVFTINRSNIILTNLTTGSINTKEPINTIRFKAILSRPDDDDSCTPILEEYDLNIAVED